MSCQEFVEPEPPSLAAMNGVRGAGPAGTLTGGVRMIERLHFRNFKALRAFELELGALTVLVGPNSVGKSSVLEGLVALSRMFTHQPGPGEPAFGPAQRYLQDELAPGKLLSLPDATRLALSAEIGAGAASVEVETAGRTALSRVTYQRPDGQLLTLEPLSSPANLIDFFSHECLRPLRSLTRLRLRHERLSAPSMAAADVPTMSGDGGGLPTLLQHMASLRDGSIEQVEEGLAALVPDFQRVQTTPTRLEWFEEEVLTVDGQALPRRVRKTGPGYRLSLVFKGIGAVAAEHTSEGTLMALALLALLLGPQPPQLLMIDDLEQALHPGAQQRLVTLLRAVLAQRPALQILATTHSPDLVDACRPDEVRVMGGSPASGVLARPLSDHPEADKWLKLLRVGEFWSTVGEDWLQPEPPGVAEQA